jgi:anti-sigma B factor antagonist
MSHKHQIFPRQVVNGFAIVFIDGEIDLAIADLLTEELESAIVESSPFLLIDLTSVTFMDSSGLSALLRAYKLATSAGGEVRLVGPNATVSKLLRVTELNHVLPVHDTIESASFDDVLGEGADVLSEGARTDTVLAEAPHTAAAGG